MNSTLKPALSTSPQNTSVTNQVNKSMHQQAAPTSYGQPSGLMPQNPYPNMNMAHNHPNAPQNHFSLNVPSATTPHYNMGTIPPSNHPVANLSQSSPTQQAYTPPKSATYSSGYQSNLGHPTNQNTLPPVSQTLPATTPTVQSQQPNPTQNVSNSSNSSTPISDISVDTPQSNGTPEAKSLQKPEVQDNHVSPSPPVCTPSPTPQSLPVTPQLTEKSKATPPVQEKKPPPPGEAVMTPSPSPQLPAIESSQPATADESVASLVKPTEQSEDPLQTAEVANESVAPAEESDETIEKTPANPEENSEEKPVTTADIDKDSVCQEDNETEKILTESEIEEVVEEQVNLPSPVVPKLKDQKTGTLEIVSRTPMRKTKATKPDESPKPSKAEPKTPVQKSPSTGKAKRQRIRTQPYQSPLPEIEIITKISSSTPRTRHNDEKLIYFYKNEFLAVRNAEGGFYICQALQNIYKSTSKIKIRWLSQDKNDKSGEIFTPDFYDLTDFDCILTSLDLARVDKGKFRLKPAERERTDSILKRCLAVEKGEIVTPSLSEEHPDGLDLSLYKDEEQLKKKKGSKRKATPRSVSPKKVVHTKKTPEAPKVRKVEKPIVKKVVAKPVVVKKVVPPPEPPKKASTSTTRAARGKRKSDPKTSPVIDMKKARVLAKIGRKAAIAAGSSRSQSTSIKSAKVSKPAPSSSKTKTSTVLPAKVTTTTRKTKRSSRK